MEVDIFIPCSVDRFAPETGRNMIKVLSKLDIFAQYYPSQACCGQCFFNDGYWDKASVMGEKFLQTFKGKTPIVVPTTSCAYFVKQNYKELFHNTSLHLEYKQMAERVWDFTDFLVNKLHVIAIDSNFQGNVAYFSSCAARKYGLTTEPVSLLKGVKGVNLLEIDNFDECCGFGGQFALKYEPISIALASNKVYAAIEAGANYITSTDTSCLLHLESLIKKENLPIQCIHLIDILV